jgi:hypothetical protein
MNQIKTWILFNLICLVLTRDYIFRYMYGEPITGQRVTMGDAVPLGGVKCLVVSGHGKAILYVVLL